MSKRKKTAIIIVIIIAAVAAICVGVFASRGRKTEKKVKETPKQTAAAVEEGVQDAAGPTKESYLTGEDIPEDTASNRPAAIMIEDTKAALPHYGINSAGVVYECPMEGGMSRLMGVFDNFAYSSLDKIGNVRSCRPYFAYIASEYDAVYVHFGQSVQGQAVLDTGVVDHLSGLDGALSNTFYRTNDKKAPHNAYTSGSGIHDGISKKGFRTTYADGYSGHFNFAPKDTPYVPADGADCAKLDLYYPNTKPSFVYDASTGLYNRYEFGEAVTDGNDGQQIAVRNIILQDVPSSVYENSSTPYLNIPLTGSGSGKYLTQGKVVDITWSKDSDSGVTHYYNADGSEIQLNRGKTWICLVENANAGGNQFSESAQ